MDKLVKHLVPFGVMGIVFIVALTGALSVGLVGAAAFTAAMAALGPGGMIGGIVTLLIIGLVTELMANYGGDAIVLAVIKEQLKTRTKEEIWDEVSRRKLISNDLKLKIKDYLDKA